MANQEKRDRGQLRQIAKELLPDLLKSEAFIAIQRQVFGRLEEIAKTINAKLSAMEEEQRKFQSYIVRELAPKVPQPTETQEKKSE